MSVPKNKFAIGDHVTVCTSYSSIGRGYSNTGRGLYVVTRVLPWTDHGWQYRIRNENEPHERVVEEEQLRFIPTVTSVIEPSRR